ncbi:MAG: OmpA family protein [Spirochaetaceae bacterium]|jgi:outer membrane protein OmpA-like peptidoglycan-associated protein|nr:OmpA family protein [Spirochaetaceae bacterium]
MNKAAHKRFLTGVFSFIFLTSAVTGNTLNFKVQTTEPYTIVERSDFSRYDNGKYIGHVYREVRAAINPSGTEQDGSTRYKGNFIVMEETVRDMRQNARPVNAVVPVNFALNANGGIRIDDDRGFPALRNFPFYSQNGITKGDTWKAAGQRAVDPLNENKTLILPFTAVYEYKGIEDYKGIPVHRIEASYKSDADFSSVSAAGLRQTDDKFSKLTGKHDVTILIAVENGMMLLSRDVLDETFSWNDGKTVRFKGFTLCFAQGIIPLDGGKIKKGIENVGGIELEPVDAGLRLSIRDLQFASDSSELLPSESARLDRIAASLAGIEGRTFLVEGHTASTGRPENEMKLSQERAKRIVDELAARGIPLGRFIYKGWGGAKPVGDNNTDAGRKLNRRVEITILD